MEQPVIHLASVAGSTRKLLADLACADARDLIGRVQAAVGDGYRVDGDAALIEAAEDDDHGGRADDAERAACVTRCLGDEGVAAFVALRGGAWLTRILDRIDFAVLARRRRPIAIFGFSELTTLLNIAAGYSAALCVHDLGPAFLLAGLRRFAELYPDRLGRQEADARFGQEFLAFFEDVRRILEGRGSMRSITGELVAGELPPESSARFVGGNLAVMVTLLGTPFHDAIDPAGRWLLIEDINESPERIDRRLAQLKLTGFFQRAAGLLVGDFRERDKNHQPAALELLPYHLPSGRALPVITTRDVGHVWPMSPLPLNRPVTLRRTDEVAVSFEIAWPSLTGLRPDPRGARD